MEWKYCLDRLCEGAFGCEFPLKAGTLQEGEAAEKLIIWRYAKNYCDFTKFINPVAVHTYLTEVSLSPGNLHRKALGPFWESCYLRVLLLQSSKKVSPKICTHVNAYPRVWGETARYPEQAMAWQWIRTRNGIGKSIGFIRGRHWRIRQFLTTIDYS